jgi:ribonuclease E
VREQQLAQTDLTLAVATGAQPENGAPAEDGEGAAPRSRRRRGGRRERGERRPDSVEGAIADVAAVEGDLSVGASAANEAAIAARETQSALPLDIPAAVPVAAEPAPVIELAPAIEAAPAVEVAPVIEVAAVAETPVEPLTIAPAVVEAAAVATTAVDETVANAGAVDAEVAATPVVEVAVEPVNVQTPAVDEPAPVAAPLNDASESTLVRAMENLGAAPVHAAAAPAVAPVADLQSTLADSGLVLVETSAERAAGTESVAVEQPQLGRRRRPAPVVSSEPMQQVETRDE